MGFVLYDRGVGGAKPETMIDTPAIIGGAFGDGRVLASSGHPGWSEGLEDFFPRLVLWAARRDGLLEGSDADDPLLSLDSAIQSPQRDRA